jgi:hypothetical protein
MPTNANVFAVAEEKGVVQVCKNNNNNNNNNNNKMMLNNSYCLRSFLMCDETIKRCMYCKQPTLNATPLL